MRGPVQCRCAVSLRRVDIDALLDERPYSRSILAADSFDQARVGANRAERNLRGRE
jgi:hypothetical protein